MANACGAIGRPKGNLTTDVEAVSCLQLIVIVLELRGAGIWIRVLGGFSERTFLEFLSGLAAVRRIIVVEPLQVGAVGAGSGGGGRIAVGLRLMEIWVVVPEFDWLLSVWAYCRFSINDGPAKTLISLKQHHICHR